MTPFDTALEILLALQLAMGLFDIVYHHELTERLTWRASAARELKLHALRNALYGVIFLALAWLRLEGAWAWLLMAVMVFEVLLTLADFVEEDRSRLLPASERVTHALLALNYGALLALLAPALLDATARPTAAAWAGGGLFAWILTAASLGCLYWGWRDGRRARRVARPPVPAAGLADAFLERRQRVLVTGGSGFVGRRLVAALVAAGHEVTVLLRDRRKAAGLPTPLTIAGSLMELPARSRFDAIVHLAGEPVAAPWTAARRRRILASRVGMTEQLLDWCRRAEAPPRLLIGASAVGWYGDAGEAVLSESAAAGRGFAAETCVAVETALARAPLQGLRAVALRIGLVLDGEGGMLGRLLLAAELGFAPRFGGGRQWLSWIHRDDLVRLICWLLAQPAAAGLYNATAPHPLRQGDFVTALARCFRRHPLVVPVPRWLLSGLGAMGRELLLAGQRALPRRALAEGFRFQHHHPAEALAAICGQGPVPDLRPLVTRLPSGSPDRASNGRCKPAAVLRKVA